MQFAIDLVQKIPAGWPRWAALGAIAITYLFFPNLVKKLGGARQEKEILERLTRFLQVKKLLLELQVFQREKDIPGFEFPGEARLMAELKESYAAVEKSKVKIPYVTRLQYSLVGSMAFFLLTLTAFFFDRFQEAAALETVKFLLGDLSFSIACGLVASLISLGTLRSSFFYGLTMPLAITLLILLVHPQLRS